MTLEIILSKIKLILNFKLVIKLKRLFNLEYLVLNTFYD